MMITLRDRGLQGVLLRIAWGPRRVTSSKRYGALDSAYPNEVTAGHGLWLTWAKRGVKEWLFGPTCIVVPPSKASRRVKQAIAGIDDEKRTSMSDDMVKALLSEREAMRAAKRFDEADEIRNRLLAAGASIQDKKLK